MKLVQFIVAYLYKTVLLQIFIKLVYRSAQQKCLKFVLCKCEKKILTSARFSCQTFRAAHVRCVEEKSVYIFFQTVSVATSVFSQIITLSNEGIQCCFYNCEVLSCEQLMNSCDVISQFQSNTFMVLVFLISALFALFEFFIQFQTKLSLKSSLESFFYSYLH